MRPSTEGANIRRETGDSWCDSAEARLRAIVREKDVELAELREKVRKIELDLAVARGTVKSFRAGAAS